MSDQLVMPKYLDDSTTDSSNLISKTMYLQTIVSLTLSHSLKKLQKKTSHVFNMINLNNEKRHVVK